MVAIVDALNRAYDVTEWRPWWKRRLVAIGLTIALALFIIISPHTEVRTLAGENALLDDIQRSPAGRVDMRPSQLDRLGWAGDGISQGEP